LIIHVEIIEEALDVGIQYIVHLLFHERIRQRIQRLMLAASRTKSIREAEEVLLIDMVEDGDHCMLDDLVLQGGDPERTLPSVALLDVDPSRWKRPIRTAMQPTVQIGWNSFRCTSCGAKRGDTPRAISEDPARGTDI
jgi:hypothetical protein